MPKRFVVQEVSDSVQHRNGTRQKPRTRARDGELMRMTSVHLPITLLRRANVLAVERDCSFSEVVETALVALLEQRRAG